MTNGWPSLPNRLPAFPQGRVHVHWVPGHAGIAGNEAADRQVNLGATTPASAPAPPLPGYPGPGGPLRKSWQNCFEEYWATHAPQSYKNLAIPLDPSPLELSFPRIP